MRKQKTLAKECCWPWLCMLTISKEVSALQDNNPHDDKWDNKDCALMMMNSMFYKSIFKHK